MKGIYVPVVNDRLSLPLVCLLNACFLPVLNTTNVYELRGRPFNFLLSVPVSLHGPGATLPTQPWLTGVDLRAKEGKEGKSKVQVTAGTAPRG